MKNSKNAQHARSVLMFGLLAALGFNLSWNPEQFTMARSEFVKASAEGLFEMDLASRSLANDTAAANATTSTTTSDSFQMELATYDASLKGIAVHFTRLQGNKVQFNIVSPERCPDCWKTIQYETLKAEDMVSRQTMEAAIARLAIEKFKDRFKPLASSAKDDDKPKRNKKWVATSACNEETHGEQTACEHEEFSELVAQCDEPEASDFDDIEAREVRDTSRERRGNTREKCAARAKEYFRKFLAKSMVEGLRAPKDSDKYQSAADARDAMIADLPERYSELKRGLVSTSAQGVLDRASRVYTSTLSLTKSEDAAIMKAKEAIVGELYSSTGASLCDSLTGESCYTAFRNPAMRAHLESSNDNFRLFTESYESSLKTVLDFNDRNVSFSKVLAGQVSTEGLITATPATQEIIDARSRIVARNNAAPIEGLGQRLSIPGSLAAPSGQILIPSLNPDNGFNRNGFNSTINPGFATETNNWGSVVPGQNFNGTQVYDRMNPTGLNTGFNQGNYPMSPAQRQ